jgi:hypothetical protein
MGVWKMRALALPEKGQSAVIRLINSLVAVGGLRQGNGAMGDRNGHA